MSQVKIQDVAVEFVKKAKGGYSVATVTYTDNGKNFSKKIMSFANPAVFDVVKSAQSGETYEVTVVKEGDYYNWSAMQKVDADTGTTTSAPTKPVGVGKVTSTYETPEERKIKQLYIIRQSSISNALAFLKDTQAGGDYGVTDVVTIAQEFVDFVYGNQEILDPVGRED